MALPSRVCLAMMPERLRYSYPYCSSRDKRNPFKVPVIFCAFFSACTDPGSHISTMPCDTDNLCKNPPAGAGSAIRTPLSLRPHVGRSSRLPVRSSELGGQSASPRCFCIFSTMPCGIKATWESTPAIAGSTIRTPLSLRPHGGRSLGLRPRSSELGGASIFPRCFPIFGCHGTQKTWAGCEWGGVWKAGRSFVSEWDVV